MVESVRGHGANMLKYSENKERINNMRLKSTDKIAGVEAKHLRKFFRCYDTGHFDGQSIKHFPELNLNSEVKVLNFFKELEQGGYIKKHDHEFRFETTMKGMGVANAKFIKPITKSKCNEIVKELLERVEQMNKSDYYIMKVESIYAFGSYIDDTKPDCADIDLIINLKRKDGITYEQSVEISHQRCRNASNYLQMISYASHEEPLKFLKNRNKYLSFSSDEKEKFKCRKIYG